MEKGIRVASFILCTKQCASALLDAFAELHLVSGITARESKARLIPDPFGNYVVYLRADPTAPLTPPAEYLSGEPTHCGFCGALYGRPRGHDEDAQRSVFSGSVH